MSREVVWRDARPDEAEALMMLERDASVAALGHVFSRVPYPEDGVRARWEQVLADPAMTVRVEDGGRAFAAFTADVLAHLAVDPPSWGEGLGRAAVEEAVRRMGPRPRLWVLADNHRARGMYAHLGWTPTGRTRDAEWPPHPSEVELALTDSATRERRPTPPTA